MAEILVSLSATSGLPVTVSYATADGTATNAPDYVGETSTLTIAAGSANGTISITVNGDTDSEPDETFTVTLTGATTTGTTTPLIITQDVTIVAILDDDAAAEVTLDIPLVEGFNLIAIPLQFSQTTTFNDLQALIVSQGGLVSTILGWNTQLQKFDSWISANPLTPTFPRSAAWVRRNPVRVLPI